MKLTVTYLLEGTLQCDVRDFRDGAFWAIKGPLATGLDAANAQLEAEGKKLKLKLIDAEVE